MAGVNGVEIKRGQVWRTREGQETIPLRQSEDKTYPFWDDQIMATWDAEGRRFAGKMDASDLIELVTDEHGFTPWAGGAQPADTVGKLVHYRLDNGAIVYGPFAADQHVWTHSYEDNITAYKVVELAQQPAPSTPALRVGQVWLNGEGVEVRLERDGCYEDRPWRSVYVRNPGCGRAGAGVADHRDDGTCTVDRLNLVSLVRDSPDSASLAEETLSALGWVFDGTTWVEQARIEMIPGGIPVMAVPGYELLSDVLHRAYNQAAIGKGKERHANGEPFDEQVMQDGARRFGVGALLFQAFKKSEESQRLPLDRGVNELLGAIVYLAGAVIRREADAAEGGA